MLGPARRPSFSRRPRFLPAAALAAVTLAAPSLAAADPVTVSGTAQLACSPTYPGGSSGSFAVADNVALNVSSLDHDAAQSGDRLQATAHQDLTFDPSAASTLYRLLPSTTPISVSVLGSSVTVSGSTERFAFPPAGGTATVSSNDFSTIQAPGPAQSTAPFSAGAVTADNGSSVTFGAGSVTIQATGTSSPDADGATTSVQRLFTCSASPTVALGALPVEQPVSADGTQFTETYRNVCTSTGSPAFITATVRLQVSSANPRTGDALQVASNTTLWFDGAASSRFFSLNLGAGSPVSLRTSTIPVAVTGTEVASLDAGGTGAAGGTSIASPYGGTPFTITVPRTGFGPSTSAGTVTAAAGGSVTFTPNPFKIVASFNLPPLPDAPAGPPGIATFTCTPSASPIVLPVSAAPASSISAVVPRTGPSTGGNLIVIHGNFPSPVYAVVFGDDAIAQVVSQTSTSVTVIVPAGVAGDMVRVAVVDGSGIVQVVGDDTYTYSADLPVTTSRAYAIAGTATLTSLVRGTLPITGSLAATIRNDTGALTNGSLAFDRSSAKLVAIGFLPVQASVDLVPTAPVTGTVSATAFDGVAKLRVKLPSLSVLGVKLGGGGNCQAAQVSTVALKSVGTFSQAAGGTLAGSFAISNLAGCGALNGLVSSLTASSGNAIVLTLKPTT